MSTTAHFCIATVNRSKRLTYTLDQLTSIYESLGVRITRYPITTDTNRDAIFLKDNWATSPLGLIKANMAKESRKHEPKLVFDFLGLLPVWTPSLKFEGADLHWVTPTFALQAKGSRTHSDEVSQWLQTWSPGITCQTVTLPAAHDQHLLGVANSVYHGEKVGLYGFGPVMAELNATDRFNQDSRLPEITCLELSGDDYAHKGSNWVQVGDTIVMGQNCNSTVCLLRDRGLNVVTLSIEPLLELGGGVACTTGVLHI